MGVGCYDSDYLWLNLVNAHEKTDAWPGRFYNKKVAQDPKLLSHFRYLQ